MITELVEYIVRQLAQDQDQIHIELVKDGAKHVVQIRVSDRDRRRLIGRGGQTIKAIRSIVDVMLPRGKRVGVSIIE